eukprot:TRINITY_DN654_c0_g1_i1.p1 TRINITY_DN654_c0_g1~~TRINITY_DN654_c0_g1_i1.p1  ORF type:complete len:327 (+),score=103.62 TRINITY_DN654_c0_g1_i1:75-983(+)
MGVPMVKRLIAAKKFACVSIYNRTRLPVVIEELTKEASDVTRVEVAESVQEVTHGSDVVITILADDRAVDAVTLGENGILKHLKPSAVHVSMSTISSEISRKLVDLHKNAGQGYIAAPVFGRPPAAAAGALGIIAAGDLAVIESLKPVFEILGKRTFVIGDEVGQANIVKLGGNFMLFSAIEAMSEAFALTRKAGVDPAVFYEVFTNTLFAGSPVHAGYGKMIVEEKFEQTAGFKTHLALKDIKLVLKESDQLEIPMPHAGVTRDTFLSIMGRGGRENDVCAMAKHAYANAGVTKNNGDSKL